MVVVDVRLAVVWIKLPHQVMVLKSLLSVRFLIALRHGMLHPANGARRFGHPICGAFRLVKQALLNPVLPFFAATHAAELLAVTELVSESVMFRRRLMNERIAATESLAVFAFVHGFLVLTLGKFKLRATTR